MNRIITQYQIPEARDKRKVCRTPHVSIIFVIGKQTIKDLTITGTFNVVSNNLIQAFTIQPVDNVQPSIQTPFFSKVLPAGSYSIRGTVTINPLTAPLLVFSITESSTSTKFPLFEMDFSSLGGLQGSQSLPFSTMYVSNGIDPVTFSIFLTGETEFSIVQANNNIEIFKIA